MRTMQYCIPTTCKHVSDCEPMVNSPRSANTPSPVLALSFPGEYQCRKRAYVHAIVPQLSIYSDVSGKLEGFEGFGGNALGGGKKRKAEESFAVSEPQEAGTRDCML